MPDDKKWKPDLKMARFRAERVHPEPYQRSTSFDPKTLGRAEDVMARHLDPRVPLPTTLNLPPVVRCRCGHLGNDADHEDIGGRCLVPGCPCTGLVVDPYFLPDSNSVIVQAFNSRIRNEARMNDHKPGKLIPIAEREGH